MCRSSERVGLGEFTRCAPELEDRIGSAYRVGGEDLFAAAEVLELFPSTEEAEGEVLAAMPADSSRSPLLRLAMRNLKGENRSAEADLLSYLLFDGDFLGPLTELGYMDARAREDELAAFFSDDPFEPAPN